MHTILGEKDYILVCDRENTCTIEAWGTLNAK